MTGRRLFLSYARDDAMYLRELVAQLQARSHTNADPQLVWWFDKHEEVGIQVGDPWAMTLEEMIESCHVFCLLATATSVGISQNCRQELEWAQKYKKPIAQIRVSGIILPLGQYSQLPNSRVWIASEPSEARRAELWLEVVAGLAKTSKAKWLDKNSDAAVIARFRDSVGNLYDLKVFHDIAHKFLEKDLKVVLGRLHRKSLDAEEELPEFLAEANGRIAMLDGHAASARQNNNLSPMDEPQVAKLREVFSKVKQPVDSYLRNQVPDAALQLRRDLLQVSREVSLSLRYFNDRMSDLADALKVPAFMVSLRQMLQEQLDYQSESEWQLKSRYAGLCLVEHNDLQAALDSLMRYPPESFANGARLERFLEELGDFQPALRRLARHWADDQISTITSTGTLLPRPQLRTRYLDLESAIEALLPDRTNPALVNAFRTKYAEFLHDFSKYFLDFDENLKQTTKKLKLDLDAVPV